MPKNGEKQSDYQNIEANDNFFVKVVYYYLQICDHEGQKYIFNVILGICEKVSVNNFPHPATSGNKWNMKI